MEAKDTVMGWEEQYREAGCMENLDVDALLKSQAEISFKAGYEQHKGESCPKYGQPKILKRKKEGKEGRR